MKVLVTGSSGHLGEALVRVLSARGLEPRGLDRRPSPFTQVVGEITDRELVRAALQGVDAVLHTATLHKPHVATHPKEQFVETNVTGTLVLLEEAVLARVGAFVFTSTTSTFGRALVPPPGAPAAWITEDVVPVTKNIYGATKVAAEALCELVHREEGLPVVVLRTSRFFPEEDDDADARRDFDPENLKVAELCHRRVDLEDVVGAHLCALERAAALKFGRYVVSATTPFTEDDLAELRVDAAAVVHRRVPGSEALMARQGWRFPRALDRVYVNARARKDLGWTPTFDFAHALARLRDGGSPFSELTATIGKKGY